MLLDQHFLVKSSMMLSSLWILLLVLQSASAQDASATIDRFLQAEATIEVYVLGNNGKPTDLYPLPECAGDCDDDDDCADGLICFERDAGEEVPGCLGGLDDDARTDYCIRAPASDESSNANGGLVITTSIVTQPKPLPPTKPPSPAPPTGTPQPTPKQSTPSPTFRPTSAPVPDRGPFQLKMHWHDRSCWQDECDSDPQWCIQCEGFDCNRGDAVWVEPCRKDLPDMQLFEWSIIPKSYYPTPSLQGTATVEWGQLQSMARDGGHKLCLERISTRKYQLQECEIGTYRQWFRGFDPDNLFELYEPPSDKPEVNPGEPDNCLTTPHHPRKFEVIYQTDCASARKSKTALWTAVYGNDKKVKEFDDFDKERYYRLGEGRRNPRCQEETPCGVCEGHCVSDDACEGSLKCFERSRDNPVEAPEGCYGRGVPGMDYCYDPKV